jgi:carboxypeptidase family protein
MAVRLGISLPIVLLFSICAIGADDKSIQGTLRDTDGALLVAGEIRAERLDAKAKIVTTKTDDHGRYLFRGLPAGMYRITAYVDQSPRMQAKVKISGKGWTKLDFNLHEAQDEGVARMQQDLSTSTGSNPGR